MIKMEEQEHIRCRGHPLVLGTHPTTFEVTCEDHLTANGNCIIGISADKGCAGLAPSFRKVLAHDEAVLVTRLECEGIVAEITSRGSSRMTLVHPTDMVWRRSTFVCGRTIGVLSDAVALDLPRELITCLARGKEMRVTLTVTCPG
jgi:hypothetical protein